MKKISLYLAIKKGSLVAVFTHEHKKLALSWRAVPGVKIYKASVTLDEEI